MTRTPGRGHEALRRGRWSVSTGEYFLTFCTKDRKIGLTGALVMPEVIALANKLEVERKWFLRTAVVMPDHVHLLVVLQAAVELTDAVRLFKGRLSLLLRKMGLSWQPAYFDHRLRSDEDRMPVFVYIFLNPYRTGLLPGNETWPGYYCWEEDWSGLEALTDSDCPRPEWLA